MAKRFTATDKFEDPWFRKLPTKHKVFWDYILSKCNNAGIWTVDFELAEFQIGEKLIKDDVLADFSGRIVDLKNGYWFIPKFIEFQYGTLSGDCKPHQQVILLLEKYNLSKGYSKGIHTLQEKEKEKDLKEGGVGETDFERFWDVYPKKKSKGQAEKAWRKISPGEEQVELILKAVDRAKRSSDWLKESGQFIPYPATWLNAKGWEDEMEVRRELPEWQKKQLEAVRKQALTGLSEKN